MASVRGVTLERAPSATPAHAFSAVKLFPGQSLVLPSTIIDTGRSDRGQRSGAARILAQVQSRIAGKEIRSDSRVRGEHQREAAVAVRGNLHQRQDNPRRVTSCALA